MTGTAIAAAVLLVGTAMGLLLRTRRGRVREQDGADRRAVVAAVGAALGDRATLVQFSSAFCAPCRATRTLLADVARTVPGVVHVEVDAEKHLDVVREVGVLSTPTTLVLDADGRERLRATGLPRRPEVVAALAAAVG